MHKAILLYLIRVFVMLLAANMRRARLANYRRFYTNHSFLPLTAETMRQKACIILIWGHAVAQLVEALRYKSEGRGFDSR